MSKVEQIERWREQVEQLPTDVLQQSKLAAQPKLLEQRPEPASPSKAPAQPVRRPDPKPPVAHEPRVPRRQLVRWGLFALLPVALASGGYWYVTGGQLMSTDDAFVEADKVGISTDVSGIVQDVDVHDNEHVSAGEVLYRLDPLQFQIALNNAKANLAETALSIDAMKQDYKRMLSDITAEQAQVDLDQINFNRQKMLLPSGAASQATFDHAHYMLLNDKSKLELLQQQAATQLARLAGNADIETTEHPQYQQAQATVDEAQRELDHTVVAAPFTGTVTNVPAIAPGKYLAASVTAFFLVATDHAWVEEIPRKPR